jgi:Ras-related protein Rab-2A
MYKYDYLFKMILVGDSSVGKSCLLYQYLNGQFNDNSDPTIGIEFGNKDVAVGKRNVRLQIWDSAGQENYKSITRSYYRGVICAFLVFDITSEKSFENAIGNWYDEASQYGHKKMYFVLVGNKTDLETERKVSREEALSFCEQHSILYRETSAKNYPTTKSMFENVVKSILEDIDSNKLSPFEQSIGIQIGSSQFIDAPKRKAKCCF